MPFASLAHLMTWLDLAAVSLVIVSWFAVGWRIEHPGMARPSVTILMGRYRREWMRQMVERDVRIFDSQILTGLRQGTAFLASTSLLAIGGVLALIGNPAPLAGAAEGLTMRDDPAALWQMRLMLPAAFLLVAFLKFVWSHRVFGYCAVMIASVPNDPSDPAASVRAEMAADLNIRAATNYNRGLRAMYFALAGLTWLIGPEALIAGVLAAVWLVWSREFASQPREIVLREDNAENE